MKTIFYIVLNIKTPDGYQPCGKFCLGDNRSFAQEVFAKLEGDEVHDETSVLCMDLVEMNDELPLNLLMRSCTLKQLQHNCGVIAKELFKAYNLEEM